MGKYLKKAISSLKNSTYKGLTKLKETSLDVLDYQHYKMRCLEKYFTDKIPLGNIGYKNTKISSNTDALSNTGLGLTALATGAIGLGLTIYAFSNPDSSADKYCWAGVIGLIMMAAAGGMGWACSENEHSERIAKKDRENDIMDRQRKEYEKWQQEKRERKERRRDKREHKKREKERKKREKEEDKRREILSKHVPKINLDFYVENLEQNTYSPLTIKAMNTGNGDALSLYIELEARVITENKRFSYQNPLKINKEIEDIMEIKPTERGIMKWKLHARYNDVLNRSYTEDIEKWVNVDHEPMPRFQQAGGDIIEHSTVLKDSTAIRSNIGKGKQSF